MNNIFFSVVIPCYNSKDYIIETLQSLKNQTFKDFEIVLIDDHSTDDSFKIAKKYFEDNNLVGQCVVKDLTNYPKGVSGARNQGINLAVGEWICFLDSDDLFIRDKLFCTFNLINQNPDIKAFHHAVTEFDDTTGKSIQNIVLDALRGIHYKLPALLDANNICTSTVTMKRDLLIDIGKFNVNLNGIEDYYCWLVVSTQLPWCYSCDILTLYRVRKESLMGFKPLNHYIKQNVSLLRCIKSINIISYPDYIKLQTHLMDKIIIYYTNNSVNRFGMFKTYLGLFNLVKYRYFSTFLQNIYRITKNYWLFLLFKK